MFKNDPMVWRGCKFESKGMDMLRTYNFGKLKEEEKAMRSAWFSNFNVADFNNFKMIYPKI